MHDLISNLWMGMGVAVTLGAILAFFAWALFVKALSLPLPVWFK